MYRMTSGSILLMCLLIFALGSVERTPLAESPAGGALAVTERGQPSRSAFGGPGEAAEIWISESGHPPGDTPVVTASFLPAAARPAHEPGHASAVSTLYSLLKEIACTAGIPLELPAVSASYLPLEWDMTSGESATVSYLFVHGGLIEYTQKFDGTALDGEIPANAAGKASSFRVAKAIAWWDEDHLHEIRVFGLTDKETRAWIASLSPTEPCG